MSDTVKQLRGSERLIRLDCLFDGSAGCACSHCEASDTIARLAAERDRLKEELGNNSTLSHWAGWKARALAAEAEVARLLKVLEEIGKVPINIGTESADYVRGAEDEGRVLRNMANAARLKT